MSDMVATLIDWYQNYLGEYRPVPYRAQTWTLPGTTRTLPLGDWVHEIRANGIDDPTGVIAAAMERCDITPVLAEGGRR
ncbi:hypothetical protein ACLQ24_30365, partial [Micromonospora sp. DT4]|uniref:hypothetical protein n=1 Tax=Micromonospora sp. DT4 TaxID=3393438 RepID=UPI003CFAE08C